MKFELAAVKGEHVFLGDWLHGEEYAVLLLRLEFLPRLQKLMVDTLGRKRFALLIVYQKVKFGLLVSQAPQKLHLYGQGG